MECDLHPLYGHHDILLLRSHLPQWIYGKWIYLWILIITCGWTCRNLLSHNSQKIHVAILVDFNYHIQVKKYIVK